MPEYAKKIVKCREELVNALELAKLYYDLQEKHVDIENKIEKTKDSIKKRSLVMQRTHLQKEIKEVQETMETGFQRFAVCEFQNAKLKEWSVDALELTKGIVKNMLKKYDLPTEVV